MYKAKHAERKSLSAIITEFILLNIMDVKADKIFESWSDIL